MCRSRLRSLHRTATERACRAGTMIVREFECDGGREHREVCQAADVLCQLESSIDSKGSGQTASRCWVGRTSLGTRRAAM